jgi:hypothetical protein
MRERTFNDFTSKPRQFHASRALFSSAGAVHRLLHVLILVDPTPRRSLLPFGDVCPQATFLRVSNRRHGVISVVYNNLLGFSFAACAFKIRRCTECRINHRRRIGGRACVLLSDE